MKNWNEFFQVKSNDSSVCIAFKEWKAKELVALNFDGKPVAFFTSNSDSNDFRFQIFSSWGEVTPYITDQAGAFRVVRCMLENDCDLETAVIFYEEELAV